MRNIYLSKDTGKYAIDQTDADFFVEFTNMTNALKILFSDTISVYTTRIDTVFSMAFAVVAPDHKDVHSVITAAQKKECETYIESSKNKADQERTQEGKEKTGVFTGSSIINPFSGEKLPLWIGDFVLGNYGTGAVFGDAHDERDFEFAKKYGIPLKVSIIPE
jgi:leucyl-tRNA synthetase